MRKNIKQVYAEFEQNLLEQRREWYKFLKSWCDNKFKFIRDMAFFNEKNTIRTACFDINQMYGQILNFGAKKNNNIATSVYSCYDIRKEKRERGGKMPNFLSARINKLCYENDFDHVKGAVLKDAFEDIQGIYDFYHGTCRVYFTSNRGFHLYVDLDNEITKNLKDSFQDKLAGKKRFPTVDRGTTVSLSQCMRLLYTPHTKTGGYSIPIDVNWSLDKIIEESKFYHTPKPIEKKYMKVILYPPRKNL